LLNIRVITNKQQGRT